MKRDAVDEFEADVIELVVHLERFIEKNYGPRCPEEEPGCPVCTMWACRDWFRDRYL
jgi:hypothetical protein